MTEASTIKRQLTRSFCEEISVRHVPSGLAISFPFTDSSGDRIAFYVKENDQVISFEDDGDYLSHLVASGIDLDKGQRSQLLTSVLHQYDAYWDAETFEIKSNSIPKDAAGESAVKFVSALLRVRDIELLTKDFIRSTFKEDATQAIKSQFDHSMVFSVEERAPVSKEFSDYPADLVLRNHKSGKSLAVFLVNNATQFLESEILHSEIERSNFHKSFNSVALIEDIDKINGAIGAKRYQRAINRGLPTAFFRGDEDAAMSRLAALAA